MQNIVAEPSLGAAYAPPAPACYPETHIGAFDFSAATCTEPLGYGSADGQRACGDSWRGVTEDLFLFTQEDPIRRQEITAYAYAASNPLMNRDPSGLLTETFELSEIVDEYNIIGAKCANPGCFKERMRTRCDCTCKYGLWYPEITLNTWGTTLISSNDRRYTEDRIRQEEAKHLGITRARHVSMRTIALAVEAVGYPAKVICWRACAEYILYFLAADAANIIIQNAVDLRHPY